MDVIAKVKMANRRWLKIFMLSYLLEFRINLFTQKLPNRDRVITRIFQAFP